MKKVFLPLAALFTLAFGNLFATELLFKLSYFSLEDIALQEMFKNGGPNYALELRQDLVQRKEDCCIPWMIKGFVGGDYFHGCGRALELGSRISINIFSVTPGLLLCLPLGSTCPTYCNYFYLGAAPSLTVASSDNQSSPFVKGHITRLRVGWLAKAGIDFYVWRCLFLDLFTEYTSTQMSSGPGNERIRRRRFNAGGFRVGAGIRYNF